MRPPRRTKDNPNAFRPRVEPLEERLLLSADSERFVNKVYLDLLRRPAEASALTFFGNLIDGGFTRSEFVGEITRSLEYRQKFVDREYQALLGRSADVIGRNLHVALLINGGGEAEVRQSLVASAEYFRRAGGDNVSFLNGVYRDTLGRALDPSGQATFTGQLQRGASRGQVAGQILNSREGLERQVDNYYRQFLRRASDTAGRQGFANALAQGASDAAVLGGVLGSAEYDRIPPGGGAPPALTARLANDTGESNSDGITSDPTVTGTVTPSNGRVTRLRAGFGGTPTTDVTSDLTSGGTFTLSRQRLTQVNGGTLPDGLYTLRLDAQDQFGATSSVFDLTFTLDTTTPTVTFNLDEASDTPPAGDLRTDRATVTLVGTTEANARVQVTGTGISATTTAGADGRFTFANIGLLNGPNDVTARATDRAGNQGQTVQTIQRNNVPVLTTPFQDVTVTQGAAPVTRNLALNFSYDTVVRYDTSRGMIDVELFDGRTPLTVANFLQYITDGAYANTIIHRSVSNFVVQGGGFRLQENPTSLPSVTTRPPVQNEPGISNRTGTIAMAKLGGDPNSATSQWFFNLNNNGGPPASLDTQNGGFTVFGQVLGNGMTVVNDIASIPTQDRGGAFTDIPLVNYTGSNFPTDAVRSNFVVINNISVLQRRETLTYTVVSNDNPQLVTPQVSANNLTLTFAAGMTGTALLTIRATDRNGATAEGTLRVTVNPT